MRNPSAEGPRFPATCARCGSRVSEPVSFCPHCGTHARLAFSGQAPKAAPSTPSTPSTNRGPELPLADALSASRPKPLFASAGVEAYRDIRPPPAESGRQWGIKGGTALTLLAFVLVYGGVVLLHRHEESSTQTQPAPLRTAEGSVQAGAGGHRDAHADGAQASAGVGAVTPASSATANSSGVPKIAAEAVPPSPPAAVPPPPAEAVPPPATAAAPPPPVAAVPPPPATTAQSVAPAAAMPAAPSANPAVPASSSASIASVEPNLTDSSATQRDHASQASHARTADARVVAPSPGQSGEQPAVAAPGQGRDLARTPSATSRSAQRETSGEHRQASAARSLALAQDSLAKNNLSAARRAITAAQSARAGDSEAFMLQQDLLSREKTRDSALTAARVCAVQQQWNCAWHNAGKALSVDASSVEARALVDRAIVESGAAARPAGPGSDGPAVPMLPE